jgi:hypothetical protein
VQELGFSLAIQGAFIYKLPLVGLCKLKVQLNHGPETKDYHIPQREVVQKRYLSL